MHTVGATSVSRPFGIVSIDYCGSSKCPVRDTVVDRVGVACIQGLQKGEGGKSYQYRTAYGTLEKQYTRYCSQFGFRFYCCAFRSYTYKYSNTHNTVYRVYTVINYSIICPFGA